MKKKKSVAGYKALAGMFDVFGSAAAALLIVILLMMMTSLFAWLKQDLAVSFSDITHNITDAVVIGGGK